MKEKDKKLIPQVKQDPEKPVPVEVLAENIKQISAGIRKLKQGPLNDETLYLLIQRACPNVRGPRYSYGKPGIRQIKAVILGMEALEQEYLK